MITPNWIEWTIEKIQWRGTWIKFDSIWSEMKYHQKNNNIKEKVDKKINKWN